MATIQKQIQVGGVSIQEAKTINADSELGAGGNVTVPKAWGASLTTRTSDTAGTLTMDDAGHTITTGDLIDLYWATGQARQGTVGTVSGTSVPFTGMTGDVLPAAASDITGTVPKKIDFDLTGDDCDLLCCGCNAAKAIVVWAGADSVEDYARDLESGGAWFWYKDEGEVNPIAGDVVTFAFLSHADEANAQNVLVGAAYS